jgi:hypothetical protein
MHEGGEYLSDILGPLLLIFLKEAVKRLTAHLKRCCNFRRIILVTFDRIAIHCHVEGTQFRL